MTSTQSGRPRLARAIAGGYLAAALMCMSPLVWDGYIGHGNGIMFLAATVLTLPLSAVLFFVNDLFSQANAFYMTGLAYVFTLGELIVAAVFNTYVIHMTIKRWLR